MQKKFLSAAVIALVAAVSAGGADAADAEKGAVVFKKCQACHRVGPEAKNLVGPILNGIVGRKAGTIEGYKYSDANKNSGITFDEATLATYLKSPKDMIPGTKMAFVGLKKDEDIADVIAYLKTFDANGNPAQ